MDRPARARVRAEIASMRLGKQALHHVAPEGKGEDPDETRNGNH